MVRLSGRKRVGTCCRERAREREREGSGFRKELLFIMKKKMTLNWPNKSEAQWFFVQLWCTPNDYVIGCVCVCMYVCIYVCTNVCIYAYIFFWLFVCMYECMYEYMHISIHVCINVCMLVWMYGYACVCKFIHICTCVCVCVRMCVCVRARIHNRTRIYAHIRKERLVSYSKEGAQGLGLAIHRRRNKI